MTTEPKTQKKTKSSEHDPTMAGAGIAIGVAVGVAIGSAMGNIGVGIAIGVAIGAAIGAGFQIKDKPDQEHDSPE